MQGMYSHQTIDKALGSFRGKRILVIGDVMIDAYLWGKVDRISPEAPVPVVSLSKRENRLGGAANVALNIQNLGGIPVLCTFTGKDEKGELFRSLIKDKGLDDEGVLAGGQRMTTVKFRIIGNNTQMLRVDEETEHPLQDAETAMLAEKIAGYIASGKADAIVFEDYDKGIIGPILIQQVTEVAARHGIPLAVDPKRKNFMSYKEVSLFKPNLKELREGLKLDTLPASEDEIRQAVQLLQKTIQSDTVLATLGSQGIYYHSRKGGQGSREGFIAGHVRNISDVSGAGDTVISLAALGLAAGLPTDLMAALCNLGGGIVCEHVGVVPVQLDTLKAEALKHLCN
jgi:D-glycero-beta-D-manno-heptose-7-phosphate kinase